MSRLKRALLLLAAYLAASALLGVLVLLQFYPARPDTWLGWGLLFVVALPLTLAAEFLGALVFRNPLSQAVERRTRGHRFSWLRVLTGLGVLLLVLLLAAAAFATPALAADRLLVTAELRMGTLAKGRLQARGVAATTAPAHAASEVAGGFFRGGGDIRQAAVQGRSGADFRPWLASPHIFPRGRRGHAGSANPPPACHPSGSATIPPERPAPCPAAAAPLLHQDPPC